MNDDIPMQGFRGTFHICCHTFHFWIFRIECTVRPQLQWNSLIEVPLPNPVTDGKLPYRCYITTVKLNPLIYGRWATPIVCLLKRNLKSFLAMAGTNNKCQKAYYTSRNRITGLHLLASEATIHVCEPICYAINYVNPTIILYFPLRLVTINFL